MNLEYFYQLIQLFGILLGTIGIFIVFKLQHLDTSINACRNLIVTTIALYKGEKDKSTYDLGKEGKEPLYDRLVHYNILLFKVAPDKSLLWELNNEIKEFEDKVKTQNNESEDINEIKKNVLPHLYEIIKRWNDSKGEKTKYLSTFKYPILVCAWMVLFGLSIVTYYSFELVNYISVVSFMPWVIFIFIILAFGSIVYITKYIIYALTFH